eukprot:g40108.t1
MLLHLERLFRPLDGEQGGGEGAGVAWEDAVGRASYLLLISSLKQADVTLAVPVSLLLSPVPSEIATLRSLRSNPNLVIKPADKGGAVV